MKATTQEAWYIVSYHHKPLMCSPIDTYQQALYLIAKCINKNNLKFTDILDLWGQYLKWTLSKFAFKNLVSQSHICMHIRSYKTVAS